MYERHPWQLREREHSLEPARAFFWDPRTGKTLGAIDHLTDLFGTGIRRVLVIAPKFVCSRVWYPELSELFQVLKVYSGKITERVEAIKSLRPIDPVIVLINWDVIARKDVLDALIKWGPEVVVADELHYAMSAGSGRSRALHRLGARAKYRRGLTGTPTPKNYIDVYSQYKFLDPRIFGTNKQHFIDRYVELDYWGRPKRYKNLVELRQKMFSIASRVDRDAVWKDKPPQRITRSIILPSKAQNLYDKLSSEYIAEFEGVSVDATHKLAAILKLQQLTAGFVTDGDAVKWVHSEKIEATLAETKDLLASDKKVVIFYQFRPEGDRYHEEFRKNFGAIVGLIGGRTPDSLRDVLQTKFLEPDSDLRIIFLQNSLGEGISLKSASYAIRTTYPLNYKDFKQSNDRIYEPNKPLTYISLEVPGTVDKFGRDVVTTKQEASKRLLDIGFKAAIRGQ